MTSENCNKYEITDMSMKKSMKVLNKNVNLTNKKNKVCTKYVNCKIKPKDVNYNKGKRILRQDNI